MSNTLADREQRVFSDFGVEIGGSKDFKQLALQERMDVIHGVDDKERREEAELLASYAEIATDQMRRMQERLSIRLNGISVSSEAARQTAGFFLANFEKIADQLGMSVEDRADNRNDLWLLENGSEIQQQEAFDRIQERSPELAKAFTDVAEEFQADPNYNPASSFDATTYVQNEPNPTSAFSNFSLN